MISKRIHCQAKNDNYRRLANYIADASHAGEKSLMSWCAGTWAGDDYNLSIQEVLDTQELNTRTSKEKTYHLVVSFRTEDEGKLSHEDFRAIEERIAHSLGFEEHQRHCGVHINTDNMHMHIAYNMIHPEKLTRHEPYRDYHKRDKLCRELEKEYNLSIDNGIDPNSGELKLKDSSAKKESLTGEESFERYAHKHHDVIIDILNKAHTWEDVHRAFALYGMELKPHGNGLVVKNKKGRQSIKASSFDRNISYKKLLGYFGSFTPMKRDIKAKEWYKKKPLQKNPYEKELWQEFTKQTRQVEIALIKEKWRKEKIRITGLAVSRQNQAQLMKLVRNKEAMEINELRQNMAVKNDNWLDFLRSKALITGDEKALAVLRSKKVTAEPEKILQVKAKGNYLDTLQDREKHLLANDAILQNKYLGQKNKKTLLAVARMQAVAVTDDIDFTYKVSRNGTIIFSVDGDKILDMGQKIVFSGHARDTRELATRYAEEKWGVKNLAPNKNNEISYADAKKTREIYLY